MEKNIRVNLHAEICNKLNELYAKKNADYGNSFGETFNELGIISAITRMADKYHRICKLAVNGINSNEVKDEKIEDTLMDLANYSIMTLVELELNKTTKNNYRRICSRGETLKKETGINPYEDLSENDIKKMTEEII